MSRSAYFEDLKALARQKRSSHGVETTAFGLRELRRIYKAEQVRIDYYPLPRRIKALYMCDEGECSVAVQRDLPDEPKIFALTHELKHHYCDQKIIGSGAVHCGDYVGNELIEKGAEVFAAEFIYPEAEFLRDVEQQGVAIWRAEDIVTLKQTCKAKISHKFICKRLERIGLIGPGQFDTVQFQKLADRMFGVPFYRR